MHPHSSSGIDYAYLDSLGASAIFFPRRDASAAPNGAEDLRIELDDGEHLGARAYIGAPSWPTILYFHGNGEVAPDHDDIAPMYHRIETNLIVVEFRGYGRSSGRPSLAAVVRDCGAVTAWFHRLLDERGCTGKRFVMGRSLGSQPALEIAAHHAAGLAGLMIESGAANLERMLNRIGAGDDPRARAVAAAHAAKLRGIELPTLIIHGALDDLVPASQADWLHALLGERCVEKLLIEGASHNDLLWVGPQPYFESIARLVNAN